jgi:hypothetical protein
MDVTGATALAMRMAVSRLNDGDAVEFDKVRFRLVNGRLQVQSFSDFTPGLASPVHAQQKIERSKVVLEAFAQLCPAFGEIGERAAREFVCAWESGTELVTLARERAGRFEWLASGN